LTAWLWYIPLNLTALLSAYIIASAFLGISTIGQPTGEAVMERGTYVFMLAPVLGIPAYLAGLSAWFGRKSHGVLWLRVGLTSLALYLLASLIGCVFLGSGALWRIA
jgi:hypothetical protein